MFNILFSSLSPLQEKQLSETLNLSSLSSAVDPEGQK
jgi:hypothetical protein